MLTTTMARVRTNLESAGVSARVFSTLANVSLSSLTAALRDGSHYFGGREEAELLTLSVRLSAMVEAWKPMTFPKGDAEALRALLDCQVEPERVRQMVSEIFGRDLQGSET